MSAKDTVRRSKTTILDILCGDYTLILNKVHEKNLITHREYNNLKSINKESVGGHVVGLVDKLMDKGEETCRDFLNLLQTDEDVRSTYPDLKNLQLNSRCLLKPVRACSDDHSPEPKRRKKEEQYQLSSQPVGLCLIINNENFEDGSERRGTREDARSLSEVFSWLGFRVLMCEDLQREQMDRALRCFASLSDFSQLQEIRVQEWSDSKFSDLQQPPEHGDAFVCCILSHGKQGVVLGTDFKPLCIKQITRTFKATDQSALTAKPKVFLIQACQGGKTHRGVVLNDVEADSHPPLSIPEEADVLLAVATVEDYQAHRHTTYGSWFIQSVCAQLKTGCPRGDDIMTILQRVNDEVSRKETCTSQQGARKQMPEIKTTTRKKLFLSPHSN